MFSRFHYLMGHFDVNFGSGDILCCLTRYLSIEGRDDAMNNLVTLKRKDDFGSVSPEPGVTRSYLIWPGL